MPRPSPLESTTADTIDSLLRERLREDTIPGLSLAITDSDGIRYARGYGSRDLASNDPATPDTVYGIGSVSKSFASLSILQLVDQGALSLEDPVADHLAVDVPEAVTLHHLLSHTSGYPSLATSEALIARQMTVGEAGVPLGTWEDFLAHFEGARDEIAGDPGDHWMYCNSGYTLAGAVVEAVSGNSYVEYVTENVLEPLEMGRSTYDREVFEAFDDRMTPYHKTDDGLEETPVPIRELSAAAGGLLAPVTDMASYLRLHLGGGAANGNRLLEAETLERAYGAYADTPSGPYGYGWRTRTVADETLVGHGGSIAVSTAYAGFSREHDVGIALLANTAPGYGLAELGQGVFAALVGEDPQKLPFFARKKRFEELSGEYESYRAIKEAEVEPEGGILRLRVGGPIGDGSWTPLIPADLEAGRFYAVTAAGNRQPVRFERAGDDLSLYIDRWRLHKK
ncbi:serine hydrolase [Natronosalvus vescus]|uniref:serine hydrolase n=1 Tax=Natronosalvus vescus TaxID=2953881 RepID=UPI002090F49D|nr:serine hydrolase [Natronosalvus vescus]